ncbi:hypothetical protein Adt_20726 [Abeliophyllum distichum]|uniref:Uncharacterized protein n=1 Tax=Abeliophyllum distichum TaxID=126358 RepID=A0ABD1SXC3_9LAMI
MTSFRKNLEQIYETSQDLGLLNVLLAFEDNELDKIVSIVKRVHIGNDEVIITVKSEDGESQYSDPTPKIEEQSNPNSSSKDEIVIHERFYTNRDTIKVVELKDPKPEKDNSGNGQPSYNPIGDSKRPNGDYTHRPIPQPNENYGQNFTISKFIPKNKDHKSRC